MIVFHEVSILLVFIQEEMKNYCVYMMKWSPSVTAEILLSPPSIGLTAKAPDNVTTSQNANLLEPRTTYPEMTPLATRLVVRECKVIRDILAVIIIYWNTIFYMMELLQYA